MNISRIDYISKRPGFKFFVLFGRISLYAVHGAEMSSVYAKLKTKTMNPSRYLVEKT